MPTPTALDRIHSWLTPQALTGALSMNELSHAPSLAGYIIGLAKAPIPEHGYRDPYPRDADSHDIYNDTQVIEGSRLEALLLLGTIKFTGRMLDAVEQSNPQELEANHFQTKALQTRKYTIHNHLLDSILEDERTAEDNWVIDQLDHYMPSEPSR